ncbi:hypothetical protein ACA910_022084 [Epithemia clementina (nom. ined.)]
MADEWLQDQQSGVQSIKACGTVVVVAKCPVPGQSKTRLAPLLGDRGAANLAKAMLCDVILALSLAMQNPIEFENVERILVYAPLTGEATMKGILEELQVESQWTLIPMLEYQGQNNLQSSDLGHKLTHALIQIRQRKNGCEGPVIFLGMDAPEIPLDEIATALTNPQNALLCPALDGGYGMLSVPAHVHAQHVFLPLSAGGEGGRWSTSLTAVAQIKALTDANVRVRLGRLMQDMDEKQDVQDLCQRLVSQSSTSSSSTDQATPDHCSDKAFLLEEEHPQDCLLKPSSGGQKLTSRCSYTRRALEDLGQL